MRDKENTESPGDWPDSRELMHFCRPDDTGESARDRKLLLSADTFEIPFEGQVLQGYRWGAGKPVLLVHGWNSRAAHLAFLARSLAKSGFRVVAFDGPAHGRSRYNNSVPRTNLPEFCRAISHIARRQGPFYGLIGHSFGAAAAAFSAAGLGQIAGYKTVVKKLALISSPSGITGMIEHYCRSQGFRAGGTGEVTRLLEEEYPLTVSEYEVGEALGQVTADVLVVHDRDDNEVAVERARAMVAGHDHVQLVLTSGEGHRRILVSRVLVHALRGFLKCC